MSNQVEKTVLVFVVSNHKILLVERVNTWFENNLYLVPGGLVGEDETITEAAARELKEETGIVVDPNNLTPIRETSTSETNGRTFENHYLLATNFSGVAQNLEPDRHTNVDWFPIDNLPPNTSKIVLSLLSQIETMSARK